MVFSEEFKYSVKCIRLGWAAVRQRELRLIIHGMACRAESWG